MYHGVCLFLSQTWLLFCRERTKRSPSFERSPRADQVIVSKKVVGSLGSDQVIISKAELDRMRDQLSALPVLTQQLEVMTQQHKQLMELLVDKQQQQQGGEGEQEGLKQQQQEQEQQEQ